MAWESVIIGFEYQELDIKTVLPIEAKFIGIIYDKCQVGWISNPRTIDVPIKIAAMMPVFKKKNIKK